MPRSAAQCSAVHTVPPLPILPTPPAQAPTRVDHVVAGGDVAGQADFLADLQRGGRAPAGQAGLQGGDQVVLQDAKLVGDGPQRVAALHHIRSAQRVCMGAGQEAGGRRRVGSAGAGQGPREADGLSWVHRALRHRACSASRMAADKPAP